MNSKSTRLFASGILVVAAVVLFVVLSGGDERSDGSTPAGTNSPANPPDVVELRNGKAAGGVQRLSYRTGDQIRLNVVLDEPAEEVHVHGYEILREKVSGTVKLRFPATLEGLFEVEAHTHDHGDILLAELAVKPG